MARSVENRPQSASNTIPLFSPVFYELGSWGLILSKISPHEQYESIILGESIFETLYLEQSLLIPIGKVNKNYRLRLERLYERGILRKLDYRKKHRIIAPMFA
jgi:hypothetical protein